MHVEVLAFIVRSDASLIALATFLVLRGWGCRVSLLMVVQIIKIIQCHILERRLVSGARYVLNSLGMRIGNGAEVVSRVARTLPVARLPEVAIC